MRAELGLDAGAARAQRRPAPAPGDRRRARRWRRSTPTSVQETRQTYAQEVPRDMSDQQPPQPTEEELRAAYEAELEEQLASCASRTSSSRRSSRW